MTLLRLLRKIVGRSPVTAMPAPSSSTTVHLPPEPARYRVGPLGTWVHARAFKLAADGLRTQEWDIPTPAVVAFLYCRAIELAFKAYLLARGQPLAVVRGWGHDLAGLLIETDVWRLDEVLNLSSEEKRLIAQASEPYDDNKLGYFDLSYAFIAELKPPLDGLGGIAERLVSALEPVCLDAGDHPTWNPSNRPPPSPNMPDEFIA